MLLLSLLYLDSIYILLFYYYFSTFGNDYGHLKLRSILKEFRKIPNSTELKRDYSPIIMQASSIGQLNDTYMVELMTSFSGGIPLIPNQLSERCKLIFPTRDYIHNKSHFPEGVGEIILNDDYWNRKTFPKEIFCKFEPSKGRETSVNHAKICILIFYFCQ